jgi:hypothetical protein
MKTLALLLLVCSLSFGQKYLKETTGFMRDHKVTGWVADTLESGLSYKAEMTIYREGIDGKYTVEVTKTAMNKNDATIELLATKPEFDNFIIKQ